MTKPRPCKACTTGTMAGPIPGTLANGERCDTCKHYASDEEAREAIANVERSARIRKRLSTVWPNLK